MRGDRASKMKLHFTRLSTLYVIHACHSRLVSNTNINAKHTQKKLHNSYQFNSYENTNLELD